MTVRLVLPLCRCSFEVRWDYSGRKQVDSNYCRNSRNCFPASMVVELVEVAFPDGVGIESTVVDFERNSHCFVASESYLQ